MGSTCLGQGQNCQGYFDPLTPDRGDSAKTDPNRQNPGTVKPGLPFPTDRRQFSNNRIIAQSPAISISKNGPGVPGGMADRGIPPDTIPRCRLADTQIVIIDPIPIDDIEKGLDIFGTPVLVFKIIGVFPHIQS